MCGLFGIHTCPPDHAVVPPTRSAFSNTATAGAALVGGDRSRQTRGAGAEHHHVVPLGDPIPDPCAPATIVGNPSSRAP